jgi:hypothetical protein
MTGTIVILHLLGKIPVPDTGGAAASIADPWVEGPYGDSS